MSQEGRFERRRHTGIGLVEDENAFGCQEFFDG
jgi:hypothetical protein